ncbi:MULTISPECIES: hypothetical protein [Glutamicibacter]|nr:hypothetical protein [Glutamicibacter halophytocola]
MKDGSQVLLSNARARLLKQLEDIGTDVLKLLRSMALSRGDGA